MFTFALEHNHLTTMEQSENKFYFLIPSSVVANTAASLFIHCLIHSTTIRGGGANLYVKPTHSANVKNKSCV